MGAIASQITSLTIVYSTVYSDADQRKHQSSASLAFVGGIHRGPVNSPHKWPVTRKMSPFDDIIMTKLIKKLGDIARSYDKGSVGCQTTFTQLSIYLNQCVSYRLEIGTGHHRYLTGYFPNELTEDTAERARTSCECFSEFWISLLCRSLFNIMLYSTAMYRQPITDVKYWRNL